VSSTGFSALPNLWTAQKRSWKVAVDLGVIVVAGAPMIVIMPRAPVTCADT
jgi:hypothetical protein